MSRNGDGCFNCGGALDVEKTVLVRAWMGDCLYSDEPICAKCDVKLKIDGTIPVQRGDEVFILRPMPRSAAPS